MNLKEIRLSELQQFVVDFDEGPLLVVAGPGSGKTRVLTERVRRLVTEARGHFRVLALTFTNKAANEMAERLRDLKDLEKRVFIGTMHGFCLAMLSERGQPVGVKSTPQIFELAQDRKQILLEAVMADPELARHVIEAGDLRQRNRRLDDWLRKISYLKTHPITGATSDDDLTERIVEAYDAGLRASDAYDFDDLLLLGYRLLTEFPKVAEFYRRLYAHVCIDEAQDLNEAQYSLLEALCGPKFRNVMLVGDPKQSIYGFNTSSPEFMDQFALNFRASKVVLTDNFRCSKVVVDVAKSLEPDYRVEGQLPIKGEARLLVGQDEAGEAERIADQLLFLFSSGHPDVEGEITPGRCAILARTRFSLLAIEKELADRKVPFYKRLSSLRENQSDLMDQFHLALRVLANPNDKLHLAALAKMWTRSKGALPPIARVEDVVPALRSLSAESSHAAIVSALEAVISSKLRFNLLPAIQRLREYADGLPDEERASIHDDAIVLLGEWDQYLRSNSSSPHLAGFLSSLALGTTQLANPDGVALLTVHASKGLEFEVVFIAGMAEGVFPDYRAIGRKKEEAEERRNAFVAITRSKRLLFFSYPKSRKMPWGDVWQNKPSPYLQDFSEFLR